MYKTEYGTFDGNTWEALSQRCFRLKYDSEDYQEMPATFKGDLGIEGFTRTGILFQCYCPDFEYEPVKLYETQRDKITTDLNKLKKNEAELKEYLKDIKAIKWIFVTPGYNNKELVKHCRNKADEMRASNLSILDSNFDVLIHTIDDFTAQLPIVLEFLKRKLTIDPEKKVTDGEINQWKNSGSELAENAVRKHKQRVLSTASNFEARVEKLTNSTIKDYLDGDYLIRKWSEKYQDQYERFIKVIGHFEQKVETKCAVGNADSNALYLEIESELKEKLKESFPYLDALMIDRLTDRVMANWILTCPISFE